MPLYWKEEVCGVGSLGVWHITESEDTLLSMRPLPEREKSFVERFSHEKVRCRSLAYRVLLEQLLHRHIEIDHNNQGAPFVTGENSTSVSASHSGDFAAVFYSPKSPVGIDIELIQPRIRGLRAKYMTANEMRQESLSDSQLHVYWGAKESIYKMFSSENPLFTTQIELLPFSLEQGETSGFFLKGEEKIGVNVRFRRLNNYMMVYSY